MHLFAYNIYLPKQSISLPENNTQNGIYTGLLYNV